jgi:hypothetical protein
MPTRRCSGGRCVCADESSTPPSRTVPARTGSKPAMARSTVVLPQPEGPNRQAMSPAFSASEKPSTTVCRPRGVS